MKNVNAIIQQNLNNMCSANTLFRSEITGDELWELYLKKFKPENDPIFRSPESSTHNCNYCKNFIRRYGNIVKINDDLSISTLFDNVVEEEYKDSFSAMSHVLKKSRIADIFVETFNALKNLPYEACSKNAKEFLLGVEKNVKRYTREEAKKYGGVVPNQTITFNHLHVRIPKKYIDMSGSSEESLTGNVRSVKEVFKRGLDQITESTLDLVCELIKQDSILNGTTYLKKVEVFKNQVFIYNTVPENLKDRWVWKNVINNEVARFRNEVIGTLCVDIEEGVDLTIACQAWNKKVDPANFMRATAPITQNQINAARKFVEENGYEASFSRRLANIDDIKASEILHININNNVKNISIFDNIKSSPKFNNKQKLNFKGVEEISINNFMSEILPTCTNIEAYFGSRMCDNLVNLVVPTSEESKPIFKWNNNYSWSYNGNLAGKSELSSRVKEKGGRIDGVFRFTHSWNELERNESLMDLHVFMPGCPVPTTGGGPNVVGRRVGWNQRTDFQSKGTQDVDYTKNAPLNYIPVENITFPDINLLPEGTYVCKIHNWKFRNSGGKGRAEIALYDEIYEYVYPATKHQEWVEVAKVHLKNKVFTIEHTLTPVNNSSTEMYGLKTNEFHKVNLVCLSPNYWGSDNVGNKHYFFMLENCKNPEEVRGFYNEMLKPELLKHKQVMEVLGSKCMIESIENQLAGLGFNSTVREELIVKIEDNSKKSKLLKIKF